jgi:cell division protein FtsB
MKLRGVLPFQFKLLMVVPIVLGLLMLYIGDQVFGAERGIFTWRVMKTQVADLLAEQAQLQADIKRLQQEITLLKGVPLMDAKGRVVGTRPNPDFLDELLRRDVGLVKPGDQVILRREFGDEKKPEGN